jgi:subtilase family serine protease
MAFLLAFLVLLPAFASFSAEMHAGPDGNGRGQTAGTASPDDAGAAAGRSIGRGRALEPTAPDIVLSSLNWSLSAPEDGAGLTIFAGLFNDGTDLAGTFPVDILVDGVSAGSPVVSGLPGGSFATVHAAWTVRPGPHEITAAADPANTVFEANETNNLRMGYIEIPYPDIRVQNVSWYPRDYRAGDTVTFVATVHNGGAGGTARPVVLQTHVDQFQLQNQVIPGLGPGSTSQVSFDWTAQSGNHTLFLELDPGNSIRESTKTNNRAVVRLGRDFPDLVVTNITVPAGLVDGIAAELNATVLNAGPAATTAPFPVAFLVDGDTAGVVTVHGLAANESRNLTVRWTARPGSHVLRVEADPDGRLGESVETNNFLLREIHVAHPDLSVRNVTWEQSLPTDGREVLFNITVANTGAGATARPVHVRLMVDGREEGTSSAAGLAAGGQAYLSAGWTALPGRHELRVEADPDGTIEEADETGNFILTEVSVPYPDIVLSNLTLSPPNPESGETVRLSATVGNTGPGNTSRRFSVAFFAGGRKLATTLVEGLDRGEVRNLLADWTARPGATDLSVVADELDDITELDELDNLASARAVVAWPDISAAVTSWSPANAGAGQPLNVTVSLQNTGANTSVPFQAGLYDNGSLVASVKMAGMRAGELLVQNLSFVLGSGSTTVRLFADSEDSVEELSELNNEFSFTYPAGTVLERPAPLDIGFREVRLFPEQPADGEAVTVLAAVNLSAPGGPAEVLVGCALDGVLSLERRVGLSAGEGIASFELRPPPGAHTIIVTIDPERRIGEGRRDNGQAFATLSIQPPDPALSALSPPAAGASDGESASVSCTVRNNGPGATRRDVSVRLLVDGEPGPSQTLKGLVNGTGSTVVFTFEAFPGAHRLKAEVVRDGRLRQTDVTDDQAAATFDVGRPELSVTAVGAPASADEGAPVSLSATISNRGATTVRGFSVRFYVDGQRLGDSAIGGLFAGRATTVIREWRALPGLHRITALADALGAVGEADETDNARTVSAVNVSRPDLRVLGLSLVSQPLDGAECLASAEIRNAGNATLRAVTVQFLQDEGQAGLVRLEAVPAGADFTVTKRFTAGAGPHILRASAAAAGRPAEANETDNDAVLPVEGTGYADLDLVGLFVPPAAVDGAVVRLFAEIENSGCSTVRRFTVSFYVDGLKAGDDQVDGLPSGGRASCSAAWTASPGRHRVRAVVDQDDVVPELDETDNSMRKEGLSAEQPDIIVNAVTAVPTGAARSPGEHRLFVTLENIGGPTLRGFSATVYLDDRAAGRVYAAGLPGRNATQASMLIPSGGASTVGVRADEEGALAEGDESNNAASFPFVSVPEVKGSLPDLVVRGVWMVPADPADGQPVRVFAAVGNDGNGTLLSRSEVRLSYGGRNRTATLEALVPGGTALAGFDVIAAGGGMALNVTADPGNAVYEGRNDNNWRAASYSANAPDLRVSSVWRSNTTEGLEAPMFAVIENNGTNLTGDAVGAFTVEVQVGGRIYAQKPVRGILAGQSTCVAFDWRAVPGETDLVVWADRAGDTAESDRENNRRHEVVDTGYPDLLVGNITWPELWRSGEATSLFVEVQNGGAATGRASSVTLAVDSVVLGTVRLDGMAAFATTVLAWDWAGSPGNHTFSATVDGNDETVESNENNNRLARDFPSGARSSPPETVNLRLSALDFRQMRLPSRTDPNATANLYRLNFTVSNEGTSATVFCSALLLADGLLITELNVPGIPGNSSANLTFDWLAPVNDYSYKVVLDDRRQIAEDFETDNDDFIAIPGNLPPVAVTGGPYKVKAGDPVTLKGAGFDTNGYVALYEWDLDGDGLFGGRNDTVSATTGKVTTVFRSARSHRVSLRVTDDSGATATQTTTVQVQAAQTRPWISVNEIAMAAISTVLVACSILVLIILRSEGRIFRRKGR